MKFSIITVNYNNKEGLEYTLNSIASQTYASFECLIIDGGSSDGSLDVIKSYLDYIDYFVSEKDAGVYNAMNKGISKATGEWTIFMNSGDRFHSLTVLEEVAKQCEADVVVGYTNRFRRIDEVTTESIEVLTVPDIMTGKHIIKYGVNHQSSFIRTSLLKNNPYDESLKIVSDWKFFVEELVLRNASYQCVQIIVADYDASGMSSNSELVTLEKDLVLRKMLPIRIFNDYMGVIYGETELERVLLDIDRTSKSYAVITLFTKFIHKCQMAVSHIVTWK